MNPYDIIRLGAASGMTEIEFLEKEINAWKGSPARLMQLKADAYYRGEHDIIQRKRTAVGKDGQLTEIENLPNNKIINNQYAKAVDQKVNYSFAKPFTLESESKNATYAKLLNNFFNSRFRLMFKNMATDAMNGGLGWLYLYYDDAGQFRIKRFRPWEILPFWKDADHTELDAFVRLYTVEGYEGTTPVTIEKVEYVDKTGIKRFQFLNGTLVPDVEAGEEATHFIAATEEGAEQPLNWERVPLVAFKFDSYETPLIKRVKSLQDGINIITSDFMNNMQEDARNTILVLENYEGTDLGEFRHNLALYGAVKVRSIDGMKGGVTTLEIEVNKDNYEAILKILKDALIENARTFNAKDDRLGNSPNQMNIQSMYSDLDLDANGLEAEFRAGFEELLWFINNHLANSGNGDYTSEVVTITFNRDILMNESDKITDCKNSKGVVSTRTVLENHPWVKDIDTELKELEAENQKALDGYSTPRPEDINTDGGGVDGQE